MHSEQVRYDWSSRNTGSSPSSSVILTRPCSVTVHTSIAPHCELSKE
nr:MAG TPA: hypothetical protein [Caudoviricetes sp.]